MLILRARSGVFKGLSHRPWAIVGNASEFRPQGHGYVPVGGERYPHELRYSLARATEVDLRAVKALGKGQGKVKISLSEESYASVKAFQGQQAKLYSSFQSQGSFHEARELASRPDEGRNSSLSALLPADPGLPGLGWLYYLHGARPGLHPLAFLTLWSVYWVSSRAFPPMGGEDHARGGSP